MSCLVSQIFRIDEEGEKVSLSPKDQPVNNTSPKKGSRAEHTSIKATRENIEDHEYALEPFSKIEIFVTYESA